jgi:hypothetical protein
VTNLRLAKQLADLAEPLDPLSEPVQEAVNAVPQPVRDVLDGVWLGNPLHPALTDVPLGAWTTALALDLAGSDAADGALAVGILGAVPAALTGLNDWSHLKDESRRLGTVHALLRSARSPSSPAASSSASSSKGSRSSSRGRRRAARCARSRRRAPTSAGRSPTGSATATR